MAAFEPVAEAFASDDVDASLTALQTAEGTPERLGNMILTYIALKGALGESAGATVSAKENLFAFTPDAVKEKTVKEKAFSEVSELKKVLSLPEEEFDAALTVLSEDERVSDALKSKITTYTVLKGLEGEAYAGPLADAKQALVFYGRKTTNRQAGAPKQKVLIEYNGLVYPTFTSALQEAGFVRGKLVHDDKNNQICELELAWRKSRLKLLKDGTVTYKEHVFTVSSATEPTAPVVSKKEPSKAEEQSKLDEEGLDKDIKGLDEETIEGLDEETIEGLDEDVEGLN